MAILEMDEFEQYIPNYRRQMSQDILYQLWPELERFDSDIGIIYAGFNSQYSFIDRPIDNIIAEIQKEYNIGKRNFVFECLYEGLVINLVSKMHDVIDKLSLTDVNYFYATGDLDAVNNYHAVCKYLNLEPILNILSCHALEHMAHFNTHTSSPYNKEYTTGVKGKKFLCFNKVERQHRIELLDAMIEADLIKDAYYSFAGSDPNSLNDNIETLTRVLKYNPDIRIPFKNVIAYRDNLPLVLNITPDRPNPTNIRTEDHEYFENSYFSVVTETLYYTPINNRELLVGVNMLALGIFPTEKTYKCINMKHPFIMLGTKGMMAALRERGYRTFAPFIDESYDEIENDIERLAAVVAEIKRLCSLSESELIAFTEFAKDIVEHNYAQLFNATDFRVTKDADKLLI